MTRTETQSVITEKTIPLIVTAERAMTMRQGCIIFVRVTMTQVSDAL